MNNNMEEGLFYLMIFLTLKIVWELIRGTLLIGWIIAVWIFDTTMLNLETLYHHANKERDND